MVDLAKTDVKRLYTSTVLPMIERLEEKTGHFLPEVREVGWRTLVAELALLGLVPPHLHSGWMVYPFPRKEGPFNRRAQRHRRRPPINPPGEEDNHDVP